MRIKSLLACAGVPLSLIADAVAEGLQTTESNP